MEWAPRRHREVTMPAETIPKPPTAQKVREHLEEMGVYGEAAEQLIRRGAGLRHAWRIQETRRVAEEAATTMDEPASYGFLLLFCDVFGLGGEGGIEGGSTVRLSPFDELGKGRKQATDGPAWLSAAEEALIQWWEDLGRPLIEPEVETSFPGITMDLREDIEEDESVVPTIIFDDFEMASAYIEAISKYALLSKVEADETVIVGLDIESFRGRRVPWHSESCGMPLENLLGGDLPTWGELLNEALRDSRQQEDDRRTEQQLLQELCSWDEPGDDATVAVIINGQRGRMVMNDLVVFDGDRWEMASLVNAGFFRRNTTWAVARVLHEAGATLVRSNDKWGRISVVCNGHTIWGVGSVMDLRWKMVELQEEIG